MRDHERRKALGDWGEGKAYELLTRVGSEFGNVRDINAVTANHPFGDLYAERGNRRFVIGVKTRNKYQAGGPLNATYNVHKRGYDIEAIGRQYKATLAWIAIQTIPELQTFNAFFGTIDEIQQVKERFSIPMKSSETARYMRLGAKDEFAATLSMDWTNGGYPSANAKGFL